MANGGLATKETHGPQLGNGGRPTIHPPIPGGPCLGCKVEASQRWHGGGGKGSKIVGKICSTCWRDGVRPPAPSAANLITAHFKWQKVDLPK
jgi:hypothetical protein